MRTIGDNERAPLGCQVEHLTEFESIGLAFCLHMIKDDFNDLLCSFKC